MSLRSRYEDIKNYIQRDFTSNRLRFCLEVFSWACSIITSIIFAITVPNIPVIPLYTIFILGCASTLYTSWTRGSFGLMLNYGFIIGIDFIGLGKMLLK